MSDRESEDPLAPLAETLGGIMRDHEQEMAQRRVEAALRDAGKGPEFQALKEDLTAALDAAEADLMRVEAGGDGEVHAAIRGERRTLCGLPVEFPMGKADLTCPECRVALRASS